MGNSSFRFKNLPDVTNMLPRLLLQRCLVWLPSLPCSSAFSLTGRSFPRPFGSSALHERVLRAGGETVALPRPASACAVQSVVGATLIVNWGRYKKRYKER